LIARLEVKIGSDSLSTESYVRAVPKPVPLKIRKEFNILKENYTHIRFAKTANITTQMSKLILVL
jgi:hypothetical protein